MGEILIQRNCTPWRPPAHVEDIGRAFPAVLEATRDSVRDRAIDVGGTDEYHHDRDLAEMVSAVIRGGRVRHMEGGGPVPGCCRVDGSAAARPLREFRPEWAAQHEVGQLHEGYPRLNLRREEFLGSHYPRNKRVQAMRRTDRLDVGLQWVDAGNWKKSGDVGWGPGPQGQRA